MNTLQQALEQATADLPALFLQKLIDKKLKEQGIVPPRGFAEKMAAHFFGRESPAVHLRRQTGASARMRKRECRRACGLLALDTVADQLYSSDN